MSRKPFPTPATLSPGVSTARPPVDTNVAYCAPFVIFAVLFAGMMLEGRFGEGAPLWLREPAFFIYPLQTLAVGAALLYFRRSYALPRLTLSHSALAVGAAVLVFGIWLAPYYVLGQEPRLEGFDPTKLEQNPALYWSTISLRFLRLVIVVPFMEEIFWRGWLLRRLVEEDVDEVPLGKFTWLSFIGVALLFGVAHWPADFIPAIITGLLWNALMVYTRSLSACILSHALINLALGVWIMMAGQWGYW